LLIGLWANTHGAFATALVLLGTVLVGEIAYKVLCRAVSRPPALIQFWGEPLARTHLLQSGGILLLSLLAVCVNPRGVGIFPYVYKLATNQTGQKYIQEWQAPEFALAEWHSVVFYLSIPFLGALLWLAKRHVPDKKYFASRPWPFIGTGGMRAAELLVLLAVLTMALRDKRSIVWFALLAAPMWSACLMSVLSRRPAVSTAIPPRSTWYINAALAGLLISAALPLLPRFKAALDWPREFRQRFAPTPVGAFPQGFGADPPLLLDRATPVEAAAYLKTHPPEGKLFHDMVFGSYLMWALDGVLLPMSDPRIELYPDTFWDDYAKLMAGPPDAPARLHAGGYSAALLERKEQAVLIKRLETAGWRRVFQRGPAVYLLKKK
jgi:hypothetical protein